MPVKMSSKQLDIHTVEFRGQVTSLSPFYHIKSYSHKITAWPEHQTEMSVDSEGRWSGWSEYEPSLFQNLEVGKILIKETTEQPPSRQERAK